MMPGMRWHEQVHQPKAGGRLRSLEGGARNVMPTPPPAITAIEDIVHDQQPIDLLAEDGDALADRGWPDRDLADSVEEIGLAHGLRVVIGGLETRNFTVTHHLSFP